MNYATFYEYNLLVIALQVMFNKYTVVALHSHIMVNIGWLFNKGSWNKNVYSLFHNKTTLISTLGIASHEYTQMYQ